MINALQLLKDAVRLFPSFEAAHALTADAAYKLAQILSGRQGTAPSNVMIQKSKMQFKHSCLSFQRALKLSSARISNTSPNAAASSAAPMVDFFALWNSVFEKAKELSEGATSQVFLSSFFVRAFDLIRFSS